MIKKIANRAFIEEGFPHFVPLEEKEENIEYAYTIIKDNWVQKNWISHMKRNNKYFNQVVDRVLDRDGLILDIGTGPGGGYMPVILQRKLEAQIIISDLCPTVLKEWKKFLEKEVKPPNIHYAAFDNCDMPLEDESIDIVTSAGGFTNTEGDKSNVLKEIYRILKSDGFFVDGGGYIKQEMLDTLPIEAKTDILDTFPNITCDYSDELKAIGFRKIENINTGGWSTKGDDSTIANIARKHGVEVFFTSYIRYSYK